MRGTCGFHPYLAWQLVRRNAIYQRRAWAAVVTALVEPAMYFTAVVLGLSRIIDGSNPDVYIRFAGPALVASITMNGAVVECTNNVYFRWKQGKLYDSVLCTSLSGVDIGLGDLIFGILRGWLYGTVLLALLATVTSIPLLGLLCAFLALPLISAMFSALGLLLVGFVSSWRQLRFVQLAFFVMFLAAGTFVGVSGKNMVFQVAVAALPLTYANALMRACVALSPASMAGYAVWLLVLSFVFGVVGIARLARKLTA